MTTLAFDAHQFVIDLTKADMPEAQAEALARHYANLLNDRLATKDDLAMLRAELKEDITTLEHKMDGEFAAIRSEMTSEFAAIRSEMASEFNDVRGEIVRLDQKIEGLDQKMDHLKERLGAKIINTVLKTQFAGVVLTCTIMGLLFAILMG